MWAEVVLFLLMLMQIMMTYLSHYSFSAQGSGSQRQNPLVDEFISAEDELSWQGQGYVWEVIFALCSTVLDQSWDQVGWHAVNLPFLLAYNSLTPLGPLLLPHPSPDMSSPADLTQPGGC